MNCSLDLRRLSQCLETAWHNANIVNLGDVAHCLNCALGWTSRVRRLIRRVKKAKRVLITVESFCRTYPLNDCDLDKAISSLTLTQVVNLLNEASIDFRDESLEEAKTILTQYESALYR
jgi:hypothetical protein